MRSLTSYQEGYTDGYEDARKKYERPQTGNLKDIISEEITRKYGRWDKKVTVAEFETFIRDVIDRQEAES